MIDDEDRTCIYNSDMWINHTIKEYIIKQNCLQNNEMKKRAKLVMPTLFSEGKDQKS